MLSPLYHIRNAGVTLALNKQAQYSNDYVITYIEILDVNHVVRLHAMLVLPDRLT